MAQMAWHISIIYGSYTLLRVDHKMTLSVRGQGHVTQFPYLVPPYNFWRNRTIRFKFGTDIEDGTLRRVDHKTTPKWAWPGSRDPILKIWDPLITFEWLELSASNFVQASRTDPDDGAILRAVLKLSNLCKYDSHSMLYDCPECT